MVKIRLITFRAIEGPRPGVFNHLFTNDSFEKLEKNLSGMSCPWEKSISPGMPG